MYSSNTFQFQLLFHRPLKLIFHFSFQFLHFYELLVIFSFDIFQVNTEVLKFDSSLKHSFNLFLAPYFFQPLASNKMQSILIPFTESPLESFFQSAAGTLPVADSIHKLRLYFLLYSSLLEYQN